MAAAAFSHFMQLLGSADERDFTLDLDMLGVPTFDLSDLDAPFSKDEIWTAIKLLPHGKAPGPDGSPPSSYAPLAL